MWDYILWNELTFEDLESGEKYSLFNRFNDKETKKKFDLLVEKYGVEKKA